MNLHLVGGFLGSGKTTAIIAAARGLAARGLKVGVVTNDQGKYLVDTAFFQAAQVPTVEVTGGCFCCNYDDLSARLEQLQGAASPDVIFAESVGSCADLVATVLKPLLDLARGWTPSSFSVFADCRLLRRRLLDDPMPFSDDVVYVFDQQIEEAGLLVVNKVDLLSPPVLEGLRALVEHRYPGKAVVFHSVNLTVVGAGLRPAPTEDWFALIESGNLPLPTAALHMDYARYGAGEARLAWLDMEIILTSQQGVGRGALLRLLEGMRAGLSARGAGLGHLKVMVQDERGAEVKLSLTAEPEAGWQVPELVGGRLRVLLNARAELPPQDLLELAQACLAACGAAYSIQRVDSFAPKFPQPQHRIL